MPAFDPECQPVDMILLTSLSGAGRTEAVRVLEDLGFVCPSRILPALVPGLVRHYAPLYPKVAFSLEIRSGAEELHEQLLETRRDLQQQQRQVLHLFLECSEEVLLGRYALSRRPHPWHDCHRGLLEAIRAERAALAGGRVLADEIIDTSALSPGQLRQRLAALVLETLPAPPVTLMSFGFKHGIPADAQFALDIRFLPNPYYEKELRSLSGLDGPVRDYIFAGGLAQETYGRLLSVLSFLLAQYCQDRRGQLLIAIGCTGGQHRSVAFVERLALDLRSTDVQCRTVHRDLTPQRIQESVP